MMSNKTQRCFALLRLLQQSPRNSVELAKALDCDVRSIYRYVNELRAAGYNIRGKTGGGGYYELIQ